MNDTIEEKQFDKAEKPINESVQDYLYNNLHTFIDNPYFSNLINKITPISKIN